MRGKKRKTPRKSESEPDGDGDEEGKPHRTPPATTKRGRPTSGGAASGSRLSHCRLCKSNSQDKKFALNEGMMGAQADQCVECHCLWLPISLVLPWPEFVAKAKDDKDFGESISNARSDPEALKATYKPFFKSEVAKDCTMGVRIVRRGLFLTKKEIKAEFQSTPKQARLKSELEMTAPDGKVLSGYLVGDSSAPYMQVEVFTSMQVSNSELYLDRVAPQAVPVASLAALKAVEDQGLRDWALASFLLGKTPSMGDLRANAKAIARGDKAPPAGQSSAKGARDGDGASEDSGSRGSGDDDASSNDRDEDDDGAGAVEAVDETEGENGAKPLQATKLADAAPTGTVSIDVVLSDGRSLKCSPVKAREASPGPTDSASVISRASSSAQLDASKAKRGIALPPSYWLQKLDLVSIMAAKSTDLRLVTQARLCVERELKKKEKQDPLTQRLKTHLAMVAHASNLQEASLETVDDVDYSAAVETITKQKGIVLPPSTLLGIALRSGRGFSKGAMAAMSEEIANLLWSTMMPFAAAAGGPEPFKLEKPRLAALAPLVPRVRMVDVFVQTVVRQTLFGLMDAAITEAGKKALDTFCRAGLDVLDPPEDGDINEAFLVLALSTSTGLRAIQCLLDPAIPTSGAMDGFAAVSELNSASQQPGGEHVLFDIGVRVGENEALRDIYDELVAKAGMLKTHGQALQKAVITATTLEGKPFEESVAACAAAFSTMEKYKVALPKGSTVKLDDLLMQKFEALVTRLLDAATHAKASQQLVELQALVDKASQAYPEVSMLDDLAVKVGEALQAAGRDDHKIKILEALKSTDWLANEDLTKSIAELRAVCFRADVEFNDAERQEMAAVRRSMLQRVCQAIDETKHGRLTGGVPEHLLDFCERLSTYQPEAIAKIMKRETEMIKVAVQLAEASRAFTETSEALAEQVGADTDGLKGLRLKRCTSSLQKAVLAFKKVAPEEEVTPTIEKWIQKFETFVKTMGEERQRQREARNEDVFEQLAVLGGGHPDGEGKRWHADFPETGTWEELKIHFSATLKAIDIQELTRLAKVAGEAIECLEADEATFSLEVRSKVYRDSLELALATISMHRVMTVFDNTTNKVAIRTALRDVSSKFMTPNGVKVLDLPVPIQKAVTAGLRMKDVEL